VIDVLVVPSLLILDKISSLGEVRPRHVTVSSLDDIPQTTIH
jgi:hypothetical protein